MKTTDNTSHPDILATIFKLFLIRFPIDTSIHLPPLSSRNKLQKLNHLSRELTSMEIFDATDAHVSPVATQMPCLFKMKPTKEIVEHEIETANRSVRRFNFAFNFSIHILNHNRTRSASTITDSSQTNLLSFLL